MVLVKFHFPSLPHGPTALSEPGPTHYRGFAIALRHTTLGVAPLENWLAQLSNKPRMMVLYRKIFVLYTLSVNMVNVNVSRHLSCDPIYDLSVWEMSVFLYFVDRASRYKFLVITNLTHFFMYLFISCLYMFRASQRPSSGDRIVLIHHLVWLVCVSDCFVCRSGENSSSLLTGIPSSHLHRNHTRWCINTIRSPDDERCDARDM